MTRATAALAIATVFALGSAAAAQPVIGNDCLLEPQSTARLGAAARGVIRTIAVDRGDTVTKGDILVELERSEEESRRNLARLAAENETAIALAEKKVEVAEAKLQRAASLGRKNIVSKGEVEEAQLEAEAARLERLGALIERDRAREELRGAEAALERKTVRAPFDGVVVRRLLAEGELYNEQDPILILARIDPLYAETYLPTADMARIRLGMSAEVRLESGDIAPGRVTVIDPLLDAATGTFGVRLEVPNPDGVILAGQRCEVRFMEQP